MKRVLIIKAIVFLLLINESSAQHILNKIISIDITKQRLDDVLEIMSNKGDFYFSYSSGIIKRDSLISINVRNKPVIDILSQLFNTTYEFKESGNYLIIRKAPIRMTLVTNKAVVEDKIYSVSGYVYNEISGSAIYEATVYEKKQLSSAMTNEDGYFKLKLKSSKASIATLSVSKEFYSDTSVNIEPRHNQEITITLMPVERENERVIITPQDILLPDSVKLVVPALPNPISFNIVSNDTGIVEKTGMGRFLLSAKQKVQSLNLNNFFTTRPFQASLLPWIGTHGKMSGQVVNNFSLNAMGGYTAGTNGIEIGGMFNIDKKNVQYFQAAGMFNVVGGQVKGFQVAGINNTVLDTTKAFQAAGVNNLVKGKFYGFQVAGVYNHVTDSVKGMQVAGVANFANKKMSGIQVAGVINFSNKETSGTQISGVFNYTKKLKGVQIGLINISDTSEGYSIGLINIVLKGYHKLSISANEIMNVNAAFKTGNRKLYSILQAGIHTKTNNKAYSFGYGLGSELPLNKRKSLSINPELTSQYLYLGSWDYTNILNKLHLNLNVELNKYISFFAGPSLAVFISDQQAGFNGYRFPIPPSGYKTFSFGGNVSGWFGWNAGIRIF